MASRRSQRTAAQVASAVLAEAEDSDGSLATDCSSELEDGVEETISSSDSDNPDNQRSVSQSNFGTSTFISKLGQQWSSQPLHGTVGRPPSFNRPQNLSRPSRDAAIQGETIIGAFQICLTNEILDIIIHCTNEYGQEVIGQQWVDTSRDEFFSFLGLLILAGVYRGRHEPIIHLWNSENGRPIFSQTMSRNRFQTLCKCLRFDSKHDREQRRERDKLAPIRDVHDKFAARCRAAYKPGINVCVDEQLVVFRGRCPFKVYIPSKPGKYGIKVWTCADVNTAFCSNLEVYCGRQGHSPEVGQGSRVVMQMTSHLSGSGRGCTADNFFSSDVLAQKLLQERLTFVGTVRQNKPFLPPVITSKANKPVLSSTFAHREHLTLVSYIPKRGKNVVLISSQHMDQEVHSERQDKKPEIILHYNSTKGAVDSLDKLLRTYSTQRKTRRWPMVLFYNFIDISAYNGFVIYKFNHPGFANNQPQQRRLFLEQLGKNLVSEAIARRNPPSALLMLNPEEQEETSMPRKRARCGFCAGPWDKKPKTVDVCHKCNIHACKRHNTIVCIRCK